MPTNGIESFSFLSKLGINSRWSLLRSYLVKLGGFFGIVYFLKVFFAVGIRTSTVIKQSRKNLMINGWSISPKRPGRFFLQPSSSSLSSKKRRKIPIIKNVKKTRYRVDAGSTYLRRRPASYFSLCVSFLLSSSSTTSLSLLKLSLRPAPHPRHPGTRSPNTTAAFLSAPMSGRHSRRSQFRAMTMARQRTDRSLLPPAGWFTTPTPTPTPPPPPPPGVVRNGRSDNQKI